ncbi:MAG TPA: phenylalanine--tRNA ligase subunit beta [Gaiellaceae bacterium]|nr:phenylalanine--tRNA ligase subunit beta [Gaiellaceae bacterium]
MRVPIGWLRDYVPLEMPVEELAARLAVSSCEVERVARLGVPDVDGNLGLLRVGRVVEAGKHPNADRLQLCRVDVGEGEPRQIVCGAWNFGAGATVAVALPGALLPGADAPLGEAKLRGEVSRGMILSERELELGPDHGGILVLDEPYEPGTPLVDVLPLTEQVLEVEVTGNRPDLLSVYGIAREVAALYDLDLAPPPGVDPPRDGDEPVDVRVDDLAGCPRYVGRLFRDVRVGPSPPWLRARLAAAGMRPISNVVDVTNYVMLALGNPLHAFDRARLAEGRVVVRRAGAGEEILTLDGQQRRLDAADLVIADAERAVAIAGIMGGEESEVTEATSEVLLEAANFEPVGILRSSERLKLRTEGSNRWEKGVDPHLAPQAAALATQLLVELAGARWVGATDVQGELPARPVVRLRRERASALIGLDVPVAEQARILGRLGFEQGPESIVTVPTWRARDVTREVDVVEEVARFVLDDVPFTLPARRTMFGTLKPMQRLRRRSEEVLVGCGLSEAYTWSLGPGDSNPGAYSLPEPLSAEHRTLRTRLLDGLVASARHNVDMGNERIALFEIARVYLPNPGAPLPDERWHLAAVVQAPDDETGFRRAKGVVETLYGALRVPFRLDPLEDAAGGSTPDGGTISDLAGWDVDGHWGAFELDLERLLGLLPGVALYEDVVTFPAVKQDLAFVVDEGVRAGDLAEAARAAAGPELREMRVFDVYRGEQVGPGKKSIAFSVAFQSPERTLSDDDAAGLRARIVDALSERFGAVLRA